MATSRRARSIGMAVVVLSFVAGAFAGAATMQVVGADEPRTFGRPGEGRHGPPFLDRLELTAEQRAEVDQILERRRAQMELFWTKHRPALRGIADSARAEVRAVLTPAQRELEERFMGERREQFEKRERRDHKW
jgi:Spy/CpxP family protein refolding chaperone